MLCWSQCGRAVRVGGMDYVLAALGHLPFFLPNTYALLSFTRKTVGFGQEEISRQLYTLVYSCVVSSLNFVIPVSIMVDHGLK